MVDENEDDPNKCDKCDSETCFECTGMSIVCCLEIATMIALILSV